MSDPQSTYPLQFGKLNLMTGQQAVTTAAAPLAAAPAGTFRLKALKANAASVFYGPAGVSITTGDELAPGESVILDIANADMVYVIAAAAGGSVSWAALY